MITHYSPPMNVRPYRSPITRLIKEQHQYPQVRDNYDWAYIFEAPTS
jgi:hypothetical protein